MDADKDRRWPSSVYGVGAESDPRFSFANERTTLAWLRTALALFGAIVVAARLGLRQWSECAGARPPILPVIALSADLSTAAHR